MAAAGPPGLAPVAIAVSFAWNMIQPHKSLNRRSLHFAHPDFRVRSGRDDKFVLKSMISHDGGDVLYQGTALLAALAL